jgi:serine/threonine-protein kinase
MAPEQVLDPAGVDGRADIWSLGLVLFELTTGRPAFDGSTLREIWESVLHSDPPSLRSLRPETPALLDRVLAKCVRKHVDDRYQTVEEVIEALDLFLRVEAGPRRGRFPFAG